jgi:hypothetical protein
LEIALGCFVGLGVSLALLPVRAHGPQTDLRELDILHDERYNGADRAAARRCLRRDAWKVNLSRSF